MNEDGDEIGWMGGVADVAGMMQDEEWNESWHGSMDGVGWR